MTPPEGLLSLLGLDLAWNYSNEAGLGVCLSRQSSDSLLAPGLLVLCVCWRRPCGRPRPRACCLMGSVCGDVLFLEGPLIARSPGGCCGWFGICGRACSSRGGCCHRCPPTFGFLLPLARCRLLPARLASAVFAAAGVLLLGFPQWLATLGFTAVVVTPCWVYPQGSSKLLFSSFRPRS